MNFRVPVRKIWRGKKRFVIAGVVLIVVLAAGLLIRPGGSNSSKKPATTSTSTVAKKAVAEAKLKAFAQQHSAHSSSTPAQQLSQQTATNAEKNNIIRARQDIVQAVQEKRLTSDQAKSINNELDTIAKFEATLSNPPTQAQRLSLFKEELAARQWAASNHVSYHYVDVIVD